MTRVIKIMIAVLVCILFSPMVNAETAKDAWTDLVDKKFSKRPEFSFVKNNPALPNVLIYGDSISIGYTQQVRKKLEDKANVCRIYCNGGDSNSFITKMTKMHKTMRDDKLEGRWSFDWDVIHFNVGLHDLKYIADGRFDKEKGKQVNSTDVYKKNIKEIVVYLKELAPKAKLIFATTTPVPEGEPGRVAGDAAKYNAVALEVLKEFPEIAINDLFNFTKPNQPKWWIKPGNVHYNTNGKNAQGDEVSRIIIKALAEDDTANNRGIDAHD